jgi:hypothetical protein
MRTDDNAVIGLEMSVGTGPSKAVLAARANPCCLAFVLRGWRRARDNWSHLDGARHQGRALVDRGLYGSRREEWLPELGKAMSEDRNLFSPNVRRYRHDMGQIGQSVDREGAAAYILNPVFRSILQIDYGVDPSREYLGAQVVESVLCVDAENWTNLIGQPTQGVANPYKAVVVMPGTMDYGEVGRPVLRVHFWHLSSLGSLSSLPPREMTLVTFIKKRTKRL